MSSAPSMCSCRFCGETFEPSGITNHETYCSENPHEGVPVKKQKELGILDESDPENGETTEDRTGEAAHPDQRSETSADSGLPPRESVAPRDKYASPKDEGTRETPTCPNCGSTDVMPTHEARQHFEAALDDVPDGLRATLDATETYCNGCFSVSGGDLDEPYSIAGGAA